MTKPTRFLVRMAIFLAIVAITAGALFPQVAAAFDANPGLNGLIVGVMLVGIVYAFRQVAMLNGEVAWVEALRRRRQGAAATATAQPRLLATVAAALAGQEGPVRLSALSMRSLLDGISARLDESGEILRYFTGLLIFLGLLGTFWGLLETVSSIADVIGGLRLGDGGTGAVFENLKTGLRAPLGGMGTAFSSSLFGLAGALVLGFLDLQAGQAKNRFFNELEEWMSSITRHGVSAGPVALEGDQAVPAYIQALLEQTAESLESLQKTVARAEEGRITANRNLQSLAERLATLTDQMRAEQNLLVRLAEQQIDMQPLMARLAETAERPALDPESREHIANIDLYLARLLEDLHAGRGELVQDVRNEIKLLARTLTALQGQREAPPPPERR